jgi:hypothetical protein
MKTYKRLGWSVTRINGKWIVRGKKHETIYEAANGEDKGVAMIGALSVALKDGAVSFVKGRWDYVTIE